MDDGLRFSIRFGGPLDPPTEPRIAMKRRRYVDRARCEATVLLAPNRIDVRIDLRAQNGR